MGFMNYFWSCFLAFPQSKKKLSKKQKYIKHSLVNNNEESIIESRIVNLS